VLRAAGYRAVPLSQTAAGLEEAQRDLLKSADPPMIFDVGASIGQSLRQYAGLFPQAIIHSFEPFTAAFEELKSVAKTIPGASFM